MRILDLFCGAGGCSVGFEEAGMEAVGVDLQPQPNYPYEFAQADALHVLRVLIAGGSIGRHRLADFNAIHASPPCQDMTTMSNRWRGFGGKADSHANLISPTRELLLATGLPYVIENVPGARRFLIDPITLSGGMFGLGVERRRHFECSFPLPPRPPGLRVVESIGVYGKAPDGRLLWRRSDGSEQHAASSVEDARAAMGIDWMDWRELAEAIPPTYTEWIGRHLIDHLRGSVAAD